MIRLLKSFALLLLLMAAQQGGVVHDLSHLALAGAQGSSIELGAADGAPCTLCPAFAQASAAAFSHSFQFPTLDRTAVARTSAGLREMISAPAPLPRSRGPPV
jgi:hypothetical protein